MTPTDEQRALALAAKELMEEEEAARGLVDEHGFPARERLFYLGAHPQMPGGRESTPFQPQARAFPPPTPQTQEHIYEMEPMVFGTEREDTRPKYRPAYGPSGTMDRAISRARQSEGGLSPTVDAVTGAFRGAGAAISDMVEGQIMGGLGVVDPEIDAMAKAWREETEEQEEELQSILAGDPDLLESLQREAASFWSMLTPDDDKPAPTARTIPPSPGERNIKREAPRPPSEAGEKFGEGALKTILTDQGILLKDLKDYGRAYPLATLLSLSPQTIAKIGKLPGMSKKSVAVAKKRLEKLLQNRKEANAEALRKSTEEALMNARNKEEIDAIFTSLEAEDGIDLLKARQMASSASFDTEFNLLVENAPIGGPVIVGKASHEGAEDLRKIFGLPGGQGKKASESLEGALEGAKRLLVIAEDAVMPKQALMDALDAAKAGGRILNADEQFAGMLYLKHIQKEKDAIINALGETTGKHARKVQENKMQVLLDTQEDVLAALDESGSAWGRAGRGRQVFLEMFDELDASKIVKLAEAQLGKRLTAKQKAALLKRFNKANKKKKEAQKAIEEADARLKQLAEAEKTLSTKAITSEYSAVPDKPPKRRKIDLDKTVNTNRITESFSEVGKLGKIPAAARRRAQKAIDKERRILLGVKAKASKKAAEAAGAEIHAAQPWWWRAAQGATGTSRALQASMDMSAAGRQAVQMFKEHPILSTMAMARATRATFDPTYAYILQVELLESGMAKYADRAGLYIADLQGVKGMSGRAGALSGGEEAFMNNLLDDVPVLSSLLGASERNYSTMLNQIRADVFDKWTRLDGKGLLSAKHYAGEVVMDAGKVPRVSNEDAEKLARILNYTTGRGSLEALSPKTRKALNAVFFAPRFAASRLQSPTRDIIDVVSGFGKLATFQPMTAAQKIQMLRLAKQMGANVAINATVAAATSDAGWESGMTDYFDPTSPRFLSASVRDRDQTSVYDISGGIASTWRYLPGMYSLFTKGETITPKVDRLIANKIVGPVSLVSKALSGRGYRGQRLWSATADSFEKAQVLAKEAALLGAPISLQQLAEGMITYSDHQGYEISDAEWKDILAPAFMNFMGISNYAYDNE